MTKEDKDLLLKDIYARIPYGVEGCCEGSTLRTTPLHWYAEYEVGYSIDYMIIKSGWRPYLFPLSSMTKEQKKELENLGWNFDNFEIHNVSECLGTYREYVAHSDCFNLIDWLNKNHFDYRGLIEKSLALNATGLNIY